jgi:threonine dehydratase
MQQRTRWAGKSVGIALTGGNVDAAIFAQVLSQPA